MAQVYLALYKGHKRLMDWAVRTATRGQYSHCEIAVKQGFTDAYHCYSASARDGGVRSKTMLLPAEKWDLIEIRDAEAHEKVWALYQATQRAKYGLIWARLGVVLPVRQVAQRWFCSEWCAKALGLGQPEKYSPQAFGGFISGCLEKLNVFKQGVSATVKTF